MKNQKSQNIQISSRTVEMLAIEMIKPYQKNPRVHSEKQIEKIKKAFYSLVLQHPYLLMKTIILLPVTLDMKR